MSVDNTPQAITSPGDTDESEPAPDRTPDEPTVEAPEVKTAPPPVPPLTKVFPVVLGLAVALGAGYQIGQYGHGHSAPSGTTTPGVVSADGHVHGSGTGSATEPDVGGLAVSVGGYTLAPDVTAFTPGQAGEFRFRIVGPDGVPLTRFATVHDKQLHLIVVRRDLTGYQHLHPALASDGVWTTPLTLSVPGVWRAYADFSATGVGSGVTAFTLGVDLTAAGAYDPVRLPAPVRESTLDGLAVTYEGTPRPRSSQPLLFRVYRDGSPVTSLERYLGAYGHLVVLREGDLGYVHVHPEDQLVSGGAKFWLSTPSAGRYRMFLDFQVDGVVRTASFTIAVS